MLRFLLGFVIGAGCGAAIVVFTTPRSGGALRKNINALTHGAMSAAQEAAQAHEQELWSEFRQRLGKKAD